MWQPDNSKNPIKNGIKKWKLFDLIYMFISKISTAWCLSILQTSHRCLSMVTVAKALVKPLPWLESLPGPDPETRSDPNYHGHQVLDHEHREVWSHRGEVVSRTGDCEALTGLHVPGPLPVLPEGLLVEVTGDHYGGRYRVEDAEHADPNHQLFQLLCLGAVVLHDGADPKEGHKAGQEEGRPNKQVDKQWSQDKAPQGVHVEDPNETNSSEDVSIHLAHGEDGDGFDGWDSPCGQVEVLGVGFNRLMAPFHPSREEPGQGQNHPPDGAGHTKKVQHHEEDGAALLFSPLSHSPVAIILEFINTNNFVL